jgi:hypothetical protein
LFNCEEGNSQQSKNLLTGTLRTVLTDNSSRLLALCCPVAIEGQSLAHTVLKVSPIMMEKVHHYAS